MDWRDSDVSLPGDSSIELLCDEDTMCDVLISLDDSKSSGLDGILAKRWETYSKKYCFFSHTVVQPLQQNRRVPRDWKLSSIVPIPKSARPHSPDNYCDQYPFYVSLVKFCRSISMLLFTINTTLSPTGNGAFEVVALLLTIHHCFRYWNLARMFVLSSLTTGRHLTVYHMLLWWINYKALVYIQTT